MARLFPSRTRKPLPAATQAWALAVLVLLAFVFAVVFVFVMLPPLLYGGAPCSQPLDPKRPCTGLTATDRATAQNGVRAAGVAALLALGAAGTALAAYRTYRVNQQGYVTGRYKDAVAHLGEDKLAVRLGGIYALERLMKDSSDDQPTILEVLAAFIRQPPADSSLPELSLREDVQASLTVIGRRTRLRAERPIVLSGAHLEGANLVRAHLEGANLVRAHLEGANLTGAQLDKADLSDAHLEGADLPGAHLVGADLPGAHLEGADLPGAHLEGADLSDAFVTGANLIGAHLDKANLSGAQLRFGTILIGARLGRANLTGADLVGADLPGAHLEGADLSDADLGGVQGLSQEQLEAAVGNMNTKLPDGCRRPAAWSA